MIRSPLDCHRATPAPCGAALEVELRATEEGALVVGFRCSCPTWLLCIPQASAPRPADELWRHTCCELFAGVHGDAAYREFNWSPSGAWAAYEFSNYRKRIEGAPAAALAPPAIQFEMGDHGWMLQAKVDALALPAVAPENLEFGIAAVLESADGVLSYWALRHTAERPDFHRREAFVLRLDLEAKSVFQNGSTQNCHSERSDAPKEVPLGEESAVESIKKQIHRP